MRREGLEELEELKRLEGLKLREDEGTTARGDESSCFLLFKSEIVNR